VGPSRALRTTLNGHQEVVQALFAKGAEVNAKANDGWTALT
jgi:hypothetical protein